MNRAERRRSAAEARTNPVRLKCGVCESNEFVYRVEPLTDTSEIFCGGCGRAIATYAKIRSSIRFSRREGGTLEGHGAEFKPVYRA